MEKNKISVIIPCYNAENHVKKVYNELKKQTFSNLDIIFINDGSTDNTLAILNDLAKDDKRIRIVTQENKGVATARNVGLETLGNDTSLGGEYVAYVDCDDELDKDYLKVLYEDAIKYDADIVSCHFNEKEFDGTPVSLNLPKYDKIVDKKEDFFNAYFTCSEKNERYLFHVWNKLFKREVLLSERFDARQPKGEDTTFIMKLLFKSPRVYLEDKRLYTYYRSEGKLTKKYKSKMFGGVIQNVAIYKMAITINEEIKNLALDFFANTSVSSLLWLARNKKRDLFDEYSEIATQWIKRYLEIGNDKKRKILAKIYLKNKNLFYFIGKFI
jgi:glycosyltransferase involved in cell wall biosynthesis